MPPWVPFCNELLVCPFCWAPKCLAVFIHRVGEEHGKFGWKHLQQHQRQAKQNRSIGGLLRPRNKIPSDLESQLGLQYNRYIANKWSWTSLLCLAVARHVCRLAASIGQPAFYELTHLTRWDNLPMWFYHDRHAPRSKHFLFSLFKATVHESSSCGFLVRSFILCSSNTFIIYYY